ncbi:MAG: phosphatase PAP2 family protein [Planctomycetota bacterium]
MSANVLTQPRSLYWAPALYASLLVAFTLTAWASLSGVTRAFERELIQLAYSPETAHGWTRIAVREVCLDLTALGGFPLGVLVLCSATAILSLRGEQRLLSFLLASTLSAWGLSLLLKLVFERGRPQVVEHLDVTYTSSFPSAHATVATALYLGLGVGLHQRVTRPALARLLLALGTATTLLVGVSRVVLGVHWPGDVVAGWCVGACCVVVAARLILTPPFTYPHEAYP